jgi:hypothetical protein
VNVAILFNAKAGQLDRTACEDRAQEILAGCQRRGIAATAHLCEGARLTACARELAKDADAVVGAGRGG